MTMLMIGVVQLAVTLDISAQESTESKSEQAAESGTDNGDANAQQERIAALSTKLSGSKWRGRFSIDGKPGELNEETYEIESATKLPAGDLWLFKARIKYGDHDVTVPLPLKVAWADSTPMIVVDHVTVPGLGTFDAHVVISGQRYAGTWQHGDVGGHLFGVIESK